MSFNRNQKSYNKQVMNTGTQANKYLQNALGLINTYTTNYANRTDFWTNKLNNRQLDLLSSKYLKQNADMMRGSAAFGSNSKLNQQIDENAYEQQNYLANVANANVAAANQLQENELNSLIRASQSYQSPISMGSQAAANVDAANNSWFSILGTGLQAAGTVLAPVTGGASLGLSALGTGLSAIGSAAQTGTGFTQETLGNLGSYMSTFAKPTDASSSSGLNLSLSDQAKSGLSTDLSYLNNTYRRNKEG